FKFDGEPASESVQPDHVEKPVAETPVPAAPVVSQPAPAAPVVPAVPVAPSEPAPVAKVAQPEPQESMVRIGERLVDAELFEIFNAEATQARMRMNEDWQDWHASDALRAPEPLIRALHTLVGTSRHVGLVQVRGIAAAMEKLLVKQREVAKPLPDGMKASMQAALGVIDRMLGEFASRIEPAADPETTARMEALLANWDVEINADSQPPKPAVESKSGREMRGEDLLKKAAEVLGAARRETEEKSDPLAGLVDEIDPDLGPVCFEEAEELMPQVDNNLREWRERPADGSVPGALMRLFHTIKGSARMAGAMRFGQMIHELETQVEDALAQPPVQPSVIEAVLAGYDQAVSAYEVMLHPELAEQRAAETKALQQTCAAQAAQAAKAQETAPEAAAAPQAQPAAPLPQCEALARQQAAQAAAQAAADGHAHDVAKAGGNLLDPSMGGAANPAAAAQHVIRVRADLLDRMVAEAGEVAIARARLDSEMGLIRGAINELTENVNRLRLQLREIEIQADNQIQAKIAHSNETETEFDPLEFDRYTRFQEVTRMLAESVNDVSTVQQNALRALDAAMQDLARQGQVSRSLQQSLMRVRMVQFSTINDRLYRVVRQAGKDTDKRVTLEIKGGQAEIDRNVLDRMAGPIEHILRNSVAHGIEERAKRAASGKPDIGELTIEVSQDGNEVIMRFLDDGQGLDYPRIEARARERGLIAPDHQPSERELAQMIFAPGFSTAKQVTALAGRGVGMDVVRAEVAGLGGRIDVDSTTGKGSCFTVHLPVSLAVTQVVLLEIEGGKFAVQSALVEQIVQMKPEALTEAYQAQRLEVAGERVPFYFLGSLLEIPGVKPVAQRVAPVVVLRAGATRIALHVDTVVPNQEVVIKHIGPQLARLAGVAGATVLGNGDIVLILNPVQLAMARMAGQLGKGKAATFSASELQTAATVMVVDDSVTVRKVTQRLLMREGYNVVLAKDGVDALRQMQEVIPDVMLVDIEMPRMDGFDLTKNVREHADFANVPIIMITSRTADKHRNHALSLGVDVFLGKPFSEDDLLRHVRSFASQRAPRAMTN
ncbi:MAG: response regulator, partial [Lautropia mirabilis]|nr:response regulator [Lautropia mirabilis]